MTALNGTIMQYFHWYVPADGKLWNNVAQEAKSLAEHGITALWLPPSYKASGGGYSVGYDTYDLYDLGEFDQKGSVRTKYGTKDEYLNAINEAHKNQIQIYADVVLNHKGGADETETVRAKRVQYNNRNVEYGNEVDIQAWTKFSFPGRKGKYSDFQWNWRHFDGVDWDESTRESAIFKFTGRDSHWEPNVDNELGNYDYLMFADLDFYDADVQEELRRWGEWYINFTQVDGFRLDAIKHISFDFFKGWLDFLRQKTGKELFTVGEYWNPHNVHALLYYIYHTQGRMSLFDAPLHKNFHVASKQGESYDMRNIFKNSLVSMRPDLSVTICENHDTQPLQALESPVDYWFKPIAYAIMLLRAEGYPCIFYPDYYGASYRDKGKDGNQYDIILAPVQKLNELLKARKHFAYGTQRDYFDHPNIVGWTREGVNDIPQSGVAVLVNNGPEGAKWMEVGAQHAGKTFYDYLGNCADKVQINEYGWAEFRVNGGSVSAWVQE